MSIWLWVGFILFVLAMLAIDLGIFHRQAHEVSVGEAFAWTALWVTLALIFSLLVHSSYEHHWFGIGLHLDPPPRGLDAAFQFLTGYLVEQSLSVDNILVIALIFEYFRVPRIYQHRTLFWGIIGALVMRGVMIGVGAVLIKQFDWIIYVFGALLFFTAIKLLFAGEGHVDPERNVLVRLARKFYPVSAQFEGERFFTRIDGRRAMTPLFLVLLVIESTDVLFAVDSIPAIFAITQDSFIVFTSNVFAILGLRSLYFAVAGAVKKFKYLKISLVFVLAFIGVKMMASHHFHIDTLVSLGVVVSFLSVGVIASLLAARGQPPPPEPTVFAVVPIEPQAVDWRRITRRILVLIAGTAIVLVGLVAVILPGLPAVLIVPAGLALLATEFLWARQLLTAMKDKVRRTLTSNAK